MAKRPRIPQATVPFALALSAALLSACAGFPAKAPAGSADSAKESLFTVDGKAGRLQISDGGREGTPVVFVHGLGCAIDCWRAQLDHLRPARRAVAYDQRGHGASARAADGAYSIEALTDDLSAVVEALGLGKFFLVGHSMSGEVLTSYAARHPDRVAGLVYADAVGDLHAIPKAEIEAQLAEERAPGFNARKAFDSMISEDAKTSTRERLLRTFDALDPKAFPALRGSMVDFRAGPLLAKYQGPRLAIEAEGNHFPILFSDLLPAVPKTTLPHVSHWLMMDDPDGFNRALDPFIGYLHAAQSEGPIPGAGAHGIRFAKGPPW
jgi:pimeloyl-ACP methyl ester carboxylesterase